MRDCIEIKPEWLIELAPHFYKRSDIFGEEEQKAKKVKMPRKWSLINKNKNEK